MKFAKKTSILIFLPKHGPIFNLSVAFFWHWSPTRMWIPSLVRIPMSASATARALFLSCAPPSESSSLSSLPRRWWRWLWPLAWPPPGQHGFGGGSGFGSRAKNSKISLGPEMQKNVWIRKWNFGGYRKIFSQKFFS